MKKIVIPTGYMGSGSSAITDLLREVEGFSCENGNFEYVFLSCPNGLFDLEDKLLRGNNAFRSDEALHSFYNCMQQLYYEKNCWMTNYKQKVGNKFIDLCTEFVDSIIDEKSDDTFWYYQELPNRWMTAKKNWGKLISKATFGRIKMKPVLRYEEMWLSYCTEKTFYDQARKFLNQFFDLMGGTTENLILDQFLLPHNLYRMNNYFDDSVKVIVVDRDPRDVFLLNKYFWGKMGVPIPFSYNVETFCVQYRKMRECEKNTNNPNIMRIHFEDMVYAYDKTISRIFDFLEISMNKHEKPKTKFIPERSKTNTRIFTQDTKFRLEAEYISKKLAEYAYNFPEGDIGKITNRDIIL